jgi:ubiquinone/menaquinone biosynthesis C-methylase UbiE
MAQQTPQHVIDAQRHDWNRVAGGWEKWDRLFDENMTFLNHRLVSDARLRPGQQVLDLGSGTGYPALLAAQVVGPQGHVVGIDLAEAMLAAAGRKASRLDLTNITFRSGDVTTLPFETAAFDAVISRFCLMFLPEIPKALSEIARVLKPGGYLAAAVWSSPAKNPSIRMPMDVIKQLVDLPSPDPHAPGIFRLAQPGDLLGMAQQSGLTPLNEEEVMGDMLYASGEEYYSSLMEIAAPLQNLFASLSVEQQAEARTRIMHTADESRRGGTVTFPIAVRFVSARKPV